MRKIFSLIAVVLLLEVAVAAQTARDLKSDSGRGRTEYAAHLKGSKKVKVKGDAKLRASNVLRVGPSTTYLKQGLSTGEVVRFLGQPGSVSERQEGDARLATYIFPRGNGRFIVAEFKNGALISSRSEMREDFTAAATTTTAPAE